MSKTPCPNIHEGCKYYPDCFADKHHLFREGEAHQLGKVAVEFCNLDRNTIQVCRSDHDEIEASWGWYEYPPRYIMKMIINNDKNNERISPPTSRKPTNTA